jgi:hypothetical protein
MLGPHTDRVRRGWIDLALLPGVVGPILLALAIFRDCDCRAIMAILGVLQIGASVYLVVQNLRSRRSTRTELATLLIVLPYCPLLVWLAVSPPEAPIQIVSGRPVEVRSETRAVYMPDGRVFSYGCWKDDGRGSGTCPAEARWAALPRWPEPKQVRMEVSGSAIRGLTLDGVVIVDPAEFKGAHAVIRVLLALAALGAGALAVRGVVQRVRSLRGRNWL